MNHLLFDLAATQSSSNYKYHGGSEYAKYILIEAIKKGYTHFSASYDPEREIHEDIKKLIHQAGIKLHPIRNNKELNELISTHNYKAFFSALPYKYINIDFKNTRFIMTIHGLRSLELTFDHTKYLYIRNWFKRLKTLFRSIFLTRKIFRKHYQKINKLVNIKNKHILTVSNHSKYSILSLFPQTQPEDISIFHAPCNLDIVEETGNKEKYFLLICGNRWEKNGYRAAKAFDNLISKDMLNDFNLVILGADCIVKNWDLKNRNRIEFHDYVDAKGLEGYFKQAYCFLYPSLNEGFGYPPLMAMRYGTPVITSGLASIPEICQDAVLYVNPSSITEIENRILHMVYDNKLYDKLIQNGYRVLERLKTQQTTKINELLNLIFVDSIK